MVSVIFHILIIGIIIAIVLSVFGKFVFSFDLSFGLGATLSQFLSCVFYLLPMKALFPIIVCAMGLIILRTMVSIVKTIWDLLPIL